MPFVCTGGTMQREPRVKTLWIRPEYLGQILDGRKRVEVRVGYKNITRLQPGDLLKLNDIHLARIIRVGHYPSFEALLAQEEPEAIAPDLPPDKLLPALRALYPPEKEALGAVALEIRLLRHEPKASSP
jgi:ASC-1-like (ASCH) protein